MGQHTYLVALGSNQRHPRHGPPRAVLAAALHALEREGLVIEAVAPVVENPAVGPSLRRYANGAAVVRSTLAPPELLALLKQVERRFGRRPGGQRWRARVLDLDIVLWGGGTFASRHLTIPHPLFRRRDFVLKPAAAIAPGWRDPLTGLSLAQLNARLTRARSLPR